MTKDTPEQDIALLLSAAALFFQPSAAPVRFFYVSACDGIAHA
jgi:hypothetical protein